MNRDHANVLLNFNGTFRGSPVTSDFISNASLHVSDGVGSGCWALGLVPYGDSHRSAGPDAIRVRLQQSAQEP